MNKPVAIAFIFSLIGTLFSGYLTVAKFFTDSCVLSEGCLYIFGYPTCLYGFIIFLVLLVSSIMMMLGTKSGAPRRLLFYVSIIGVLFSLYSIVQEMFLREAPASGYTLLLPSCAYGFVMYLIVLVCSYKILFRKEAVAIEKK